MLHRARGQATSIAPPAGARRGMPAMGLRMRVWAGALALDCRLAEGVWPTNSPELALRARQLTSARSRRALAGALTAAVQAARRSSRPGTAAVPLATAGVRDAAGLLGCLARDLMTISDPPVRGVALASFLVCDPMSPLYNRSSRVTVGEIAGRACAALRPG
jgi:hypothetical protein